MKLVHTSNEVPELEILSTMLQRAGLACEVRSNTALDVLGAEPASAELWVERDEDYPRARALCEAWENPAGQAGAKWVCPKCQTELAAVFDTCWKCGTHRMVVG